MTPAEVNYVIYSVLKVARDGWKLLPQYDYDRVTGAPHTNILAIAHKHVGCTEALVSLELFLTTCVH